MKSVINIPLIAVLFAQGIAFGQKAPSFSPRFKQKAVLAITYEKNDSLLPYKVEVYNILPANVPAEVYDTLAVGSGIRHVAIDVMAPIRGSLYLGEWRWPIYLVPGDTLRLVIRPKESMDKVTVVGAYASIHHYYKAKGIYFNHRDLLEPRAFAANMAPSLRVYKMTMDSIARIEQQFFRSYCQKHTLPGWFMADEQLDMLYTDAALRANTVMHREFMNKGVKELMPADYYDFVKKAPLNNPKAIHLTSYWRFVNDYLFNQSNRKVGVVESPVPVNRYFQIAQNYLPDKRSWDYYRAIQLSGWIGCGNAEEVTAYLNKNGSGISIPGAVSFLRQRIKDLEYKLPAGSVAPNFVLADELDSLRSLKEFEGNVVYLSFWFPGCKPCLAEIPHENELVRQFKDKPVKIVSICTSTSREGWLSSVQKYGLQSINLWANKQWEVSLEKKYIIRGYPHYVLIDQQGHVVNNNGTRPSRNAAKAIRQLLEK